MSAVELGMIKQHSLRYLSIAGRSDGPYSATARINKYQSRPQCLAATLAGRIIVRSLAQADCSRSAPLTELRL